MDYRESVFLSADESWEALVRVVEDLMREAAEDDATKGIV
jgi:hypothetical protein